MVPVAFKDVFSGYGITALSYAIALTVAISRFAAISTLSGGLLSKIL
jgi:hypothetical protein